MTDTLTERLEHCYTGVVHDVMRGMGLKNFTLPAAIRPIIPEKKLCGPLFTVSGHVDEAADAHRTLLEWTGLLSRAPAGHVVICQPNNHTVALMGELSAETLQLRGIRAYIVDGGCRDVDFLLRLGFQTCCRFFTPRDIVSYWLPDGFDVPITIGDVRIHGGDYVIGDRDGICILPRERAAAIVAAAEQAINTENLVRKAILEGVDPQEAYLKYGKF